MVKCKKEQRRSRYPIRQYNAVYFHGMKHNYSHSALSLELTRDVPYCIFIRARASVLSLHHIWGEKYNIPGSKRPPNEEKQKKESKKEKIRKK